MTTGPSVSIASFLFIRYRNSNFPFLPFTRPMVHHRFDQSTPYSSIPTFREKLSVVIGQLSLLNLNYTPFLRWRQVLILLGVGGYGTRDGNWMRFYGGEITSHFWKFDRTSELLVSPREKSRCHRGPRIAPLRDRLSPVGVQDSPWRTGSRNRENFICLGVVVENIEMRKIGIARNSLLEMLEQTRTRSRTKTYFPRRQVSRTWLLAAGG